MGLYEDWRNLAGKERNPFEHEAFWKDYFEKEKRNYEYLLEHHDETVNGSLGELAEKFNMDPVVFAGFLDGINTSLVTGINLDDINADTAVSLEIDFEKLYFNMLGANADWLYNLPQWEGVLSKEKRDEITRQYKRSKTVVKENRTGRNDPCPCGSGKKYKKCCGK